MKLNYQCRGLKLLVCEQAATLARAVELMALEVEDLLLAAMQVSS